MHEGRAVTTDTALMAREISAYVKKQADLGNSVSYAQAAAHLEAQKDPNSTGEAYRLSVKINDYVAEQAKSGRTVSVAQAEAELRAAANRRT